MPTILSASEQIEQLQQQIEQLKHRSLLELKVKLAEARGTVGDLESQLEKLTGAAPGKAERKARASVTITDVVRAIKGGGGRITRKLRKLSAVPPRLYEQNQSQGESKRHR